jgi:hypothetical protein
MMISLISRAMRPAARLVGPVIGDDSIGLAVPFLT